MKNIYKRTFVFLLLCVAGGIAFAGPSSEDTTIRVGMELQFPPFETTDTNGDPAGISIDIANALGDYLEREVEIVNTAWTGLIPALQAGTVDIVISSMTITEERDKSIDFSDPYARSDLVLLANIDSSIQSFEDLDALGRVIAVKTGTTGDLLAKSRITKGEIRVFDEVATAILEVTQSKADAFIYDELTVYENWKSNPDTTRMILTPPQGVPVQYWGMGIQEGNDDFRAQVNAFIRQYREEKGFERAANRYLSEIRSVFAEQGLPFVFDVEE